MRTKLTVLNLVGLNKVMIEKRIENMNGMRRRRRRRRRWKKENGRRPSKKGVR